MGLPVAQLAVSRHGTPIGAILLLTQGTAILALEFEDAGARFENTLRRHHPGATRAAVPAYASAIAAWFEGDLAALDAIPLAPSGTAFQQRVWAALHAIPRGTTTTYGSLARSIGRPDAARAAGAANGANPIAILIPCHRLVGANGDLVRYGGGLHRKAWLLDHERSNTDRLPSRSPALAR